MSILYTGGFRGCTYKKGLWDKKHYTVTKQKKTKQIPAAAVLKPLQTMHRCGKLTNVSTLFNVERLTCTLKKGHYFLIYQPGKSG